MIDAQDKQATTWKHSVRTLFAIFFLIVYDGFASGKPISKWHVEREDVQILTVAPGDGSFQAIEEILKHLVNLHSKPAAQVVVNSTPVVPATQLAHQTVSNF